MHQFDDALRKWNFVNFGDCTVAGRHRRDQYTLDLVPVLSIWDDESRKVVPEVILSIPCSDRVCVNPAEKRLACLADVVGHRSQGIENFCFSECLENHFGEGSGEKIALSSSC